MNKIDNKIIYSIICNRELLQYLNSETRKEFSSSCKQIFNNCARFRLSNLKFNLLRLVEFTKVINTGEKSTDEIYNEQLDYLNNIINKYKNYLTSLHSVLNYNYFILKYFSSKFNNLKTLCLIHFTIPRECFIYVLDNLTNLNNLALQGIAISYSKNDNESIQLPKYLSKLIWKNCVQFESEVKDPVELNTLRKSLAISSFSIADIDFNSINNLKSLAWYTFDQKGRPILNELLSNNLHLNSLELSSRSLNSRVLFFLSNNKNLNRLTISHRLNIGTLPEIRFIKLPYIKVLDIQNTFSAFNEISNQLIQCCQNLEILKYYPFPGSELHLFNHIKALKNLKLVTIYPLYITTYTSILSNTFPESNLEHLEFVSGHPLQINLNIFDNLKKLKSIKITIPFQYKQDFNNTAPHYNIFTNWRVLYYYNSIHCWKKL